jgi:uncharacterized protein YukE
MGGIDAAFEEAISSIESARKKMGKAWKDIVNHVNWGLKFLPDSIGDQVRKSTQKLGGEYQKGDGWILDHLLERGSPDALRDAGDVWNNQIRAMVNDYVRDLDLAAMPSHNRWKGTAQIAYGRIIDQQNKALVQLRDVLEKLNTTLNDIADAIKYFWFAVAAAVILFCGAMVAAALETIPLVTIPPAILTAIGAVAAFWAAISIAVGMFRNSLDSNEAKLETLTATFGEKAAWPAPEADISDASVLDEDGESQWEPNFGP